MAVCRNKACGNKFKPEFPFQKGCCRDCMVIIGMDAVQRQRDKAAAKRKKEIVEAEREDRKKLRARKEAIRPRGDHVRAAQSWFNRFIRLRDHGCSCISCDRPFQASHYIKGQLFDAGHYRSVGASPELRFEELNVHLQCVRCNRELSGNVVEYRRRLLVKIGAKALDWLEGPHEAKHYTIEDLKQIAATYRRKCKELKAEQEYTASC